MWTSYDFERFSAIMLTRFKILDSISEDLIERPLFVITALRCCIYADCKVVRKQTAKIFERDNFTQ